MTVVEEACWGGGCILVVGGFEEQVRQTRFLAQVHLSSSRAGAGTVTSQVPPGIRCSSVTVYTHTGGKSGNAKLLVLILIF